MSRKIPVSGPPLLIHKLRTGGFRWLLQRLGEEWRLPRTAAGQALKRSTRVLRRPVAGRNGRQGAAQKANILFAFYDLAVAPVTFDFLWFLAGAELARRRAGLAGVHVAIVPGTHGGLRRESPEYEARVDAAARRARIQTILLPACALWPSLSGVTLAASRDQAERLAAEAGDAVFPRRYEPAFPSYPGPQEPLRAAREEEASIGVLRATDQDLHAVARLLTSRGCTGRIVTITLRSYDFTPERNSNIAAWAAFARSLDPARFSVVFVPDRERCLEPAPEALRGFPVFPEAALVLGLRMALYERAYLNLGVNNGPMGLCWLNERTRYITFKILSDAAPNTSADYMKFLGFEIGRSLPFARAWQQWVWAEDELPIIEQAFAEMVALLDSSGPAFSCSTSTARVPAAIGD
jgi:hypothetical protein